MAVPVRYGVAPDGSVSFVLGSYDAAQPLTIELTLSYHTTLGGTGADAGLGIVVDSAGAAYVVGQTASIDFPTTAPIQGPGGGSCLGQPCLDVFVTKLDPSGTQRVYSTYLGGAHDDSGQAIAVDAAGQAVITGYAGAGFPTTSGAWDRSFNGGITDGFVATLNAAGNALCSSTYLGGDGNDQGYALALDRAGTAYVAGATSSRQTAGGTVPFPTTPGALQPTYRGPTSGAITYGDGFVTRLTASGSGLLSLCFSN